MEKGSMWSAHTWEHQNSVIHKFFWEYNYFLKISAQALEENTILPKDGGYHVLHVVPRQATQGKQINFEEQQTALEILLPLFICQSF